MFLCFGFDPLRLQRGSLSSLPILETISECSLSFYISYLWFDL